jgi:hypothetical protein
MNFPLHAQRRACGPEKTSQDAQVVLPTWKSRRNAMTHVSNQVSQSRSRVNDIVADVLSTAVLVLAGIIAVAQFAYY